MLDEARACGTHMLVGYELQPPTWKPGMIVVETKVVPSLDEDDARYVPGDPREVYEAHVVPIRAIYTARETRWTLVR
jgi:hypothetical protein